MPQSGSQLERYAARLNAVEINSSFYRPHQRATYERWAATTPEAFRFSVKLPKTITHQARLGDCAALLTKFAGEVTGLGEKLGVLLVQLPPSLAFDAGTAGGFFEELRRHIETQSVVEPRHASWFTPEVNDWLAARELARVAADPSRTPGAEEPGGWHGFVYFRLHGSPRRYYSAYDEAALTSLKQSLERSLAEGLSAWCIFDNTAAGAAFGNALALTLTLALQSP